jgi:hypothetical protein
LGRSSAKKSVLWLSVKATVAAIIQPINKLTQGPEVTAETVVRQLQAGR